MRPKLTTAISLAFLLVAGCNLGTKSALVTTPPVKMMIPNTASLVPSKPVVTLKASSLVARQPNANRAVQLPTTEYFLAWDMVTPHAAFVLQASSDLASWSNILAFATNDTNTTYPLSLAGANMFYRLVL